NCIEAVAHQKPRALNFYQQIGVDEWGWMQTRVASDDRGNWFNWLWAWENPDPLKKIMGLRFEPHNKSSIILSAITAGQVKTNPLRWNHRQKAILYPGTNSANSPEKIKSLSDRIKLDMGQVISAIPRVRYPEVTWPETYNNKVPDALADEIIIEFSAHPEARFHLEDKSQLQVSALSENSDDGRIRVIKPPDQRITIRVLDKSSGRDIPVKFHAHGESGEYLAPMNRHRYPNDAWFQDYGAEFVNSGLHNCTYIYGSTEIRLPKGKVYIEISKGFEIRPIRKIIEITPEAGTITIEVEKTLPWREKGWVTADTHVHFLSPKTALLEGEAEGVNIVNLLASQWGELMTNVGDFDGKTTFGVNEAGEGEYFVRVGTENRQHVLGHISLIGYEGNMILPLTIGGPDESAIGDPVEMLLTEWALQCKKQNGIVVLPHFPNPRLENASAIVSGGIDGVEMTSWGDLYSGISPYSLTDWYRYLNCGYFVAAVGGTDKMGADTPVGTVRTYAKIPDNQAFTYEVWKESIRKGHTFVTYGPLIDFTVDGKNSGSTIAMTSSGGTVNIEWEAASVTIPMSRVELVINGVIRESVAVEEWQASGNWNIKISASSWIALLIRGHHKDKPEIIAAHTSPVMITVGNTAMLAAADSLTILEQIEGAMAYLDTIGTRAEEKIYKRMKMSLTSAHRALHNRMHQAGIYHHHTPVNDHAEDKQ
ncbi:MAG TPA: CehA/McbA family metallohydrolase, partial [Cyclobacteriaceae bacterium]|nr:CehA/McbA family metallohydrolase [Cyclobacteriaceae bacterium]